MLSPDMSTLSLPVSMLLVLLRGTVLSIILLCSLLRHANMFQPVSMLFLHCSRISCSLCMFPAYTSDVGLSSFHLSPQWRTTGTLYFSKHNLDIAVIIHLSFVPAGLGVNLNQWFTFPLVDYNSCSEQRHEIFF